MRRGLQLQWVLAAVLATGLSGRARAEDDPKAIIEKGIKALGGEEKIARLDAVRAKGKGNFEAGGAKFDFTMTTETSVRPPGRLRVEMLLEFDGKNFEVIQVFNGEKAWSKANGQTVELGKEHLNEMHEAMHAARVNSLVPLLKDKTFTLTALGESKVDDRPAVGVRVSAPGRKDNELYFDKESWLVVKRQRTAINEA